MAGVLGRSVAHARASWQTGARTLAARGGQRGESFLAAARPALIQGPAWNCSSKARTMKVYTKTGDKGTSQLFNGERRNKDDEVFQALGAIDECNAFIGLACEFVDEGNGKVAEQLSHIMSRMFDVGASVATPQDASSAAKLKRSGFNEVHVEMLEKAIDAMDTELPPLKNFILPSGGKCAAHLHVARTLARRAERHIVPLVRDGHVDPNVGKFVNRLSDYLFVSARFMAMKQGHQEREWQKYVASEEASSDEKST